MNRYSSDSDALLKYQRSIASRARWPRWGGASAKFLALFTVLLLPSACQSDGGNLKIGTLLPITGDLSQFGSSMQDSASLLINTVNSCGGVVGKPVQIIPEDDRTQSAAGALAMSKLAEVDRVGGVVGAAGSAVSSAAIDIAVRNRVVQISPSSTSPVFTERAKKGDFKGFWFRTAPPDSFQGQAIAKLASSKGYQTVAILAINNDYGKGLAQSFTPAFESLGGQIANRDRPTFYSPTASSFETEVAAAFAGNPNAVLLVAYPETGSLILKAAYEQGLLGKQTRVLVTEGLKDSNIARLVGKDAKGKYIAAGIVGTAPSARGLALAAFRDRFQTAYKRQPGVFDPSTWDAAALLILAAEAANSTSGSAIKDKIRDIANPPGQEVTDVCQALSLIRNGKDINYQGASGNTDFDARGDVTGNYDVWTVDSSGKVVVTDTITVGGSQ